MAAGICAFTQLSLALSLFNTRMFYVLRYVSEKLPYCSLKNTALNQMVTDKLRRWL